MRLNDGANNEADPVGRIAHDLNNLLGVILNYAEMLADDLPDGSPAHADLEQIRRAAEEGAVRTRQLQAFIRKP